MSADLSATEQAHVRAAVSYLRVRCGGGRALAKALRVSKATLVRPSPTLVFRVARLAGVPLDAVLTGAYPPAGTCAHCGHRKEVEAAAQ